MGRAYLSRWHFMSYKVAVKYRLGLSHLGVFGQDIQEGLHVVGSGCKYLLEAQWEGPTRVATQGLPRHGSLRCWHMVAGCPQSKCPESTSRNNKAFSELCDVTSQKLCNISSTAFCSL